MTTPRVLWSSWAAHQRWMHISGPVRPPRTCGCLAAATWAAEAGARPRRCNQQSAAPGLSGCGGSACGRFASTVCRRAGSRVAWVPCWRSGLVPPLTSTPPLSSASRAFRAPSRALWCQCRTTEVFTFHVCTASLCVQMRTGAST